MGKSLVVRVVGVRYGTLRWRDGSRHLISRRRTVARSVGRSGDRGIYPPGVRVHILSCGVYTKGGFDRGAEQRAPPPGHTPKT